MRFFIFVFSMIITDLGPFILMLKYFCIWFQFCKDICMCKRLNLYWYKFSCKIKPKFKKKLALQSGIWNTNCEEKNWFRMIRGKGHKVYCYNTFYNKKNLSNISYTIQISKLYLTLDTKIGFK